MSIDDLNPYAPPTSAINDTESRARWRIVPTTIMAVLGAGSFGIGLRVVTIVVGDLMIGDPKWRDMVVVCVVWLAVGLSWMMATLFIWKRCYRRAVVAALIGVLIPMVLLSIF